MCWNEDAFLDLKYFAGYILKTTRTTDGLEVIAPCLNLLGAAGAVLFFPASLLLFQTNHPIVHGFASEYLLVNCITSLAVMVGNLTNVCTMVFIAYYIILNLNSLSLWMEYIK